LNHHRHPNSSTTDLVAALNPDLDFAEAVASAVETGYPCAG